MSLMKVPSPQEIGLPPKFDKWRSSQEHAVDVMITGQKRATVMSMPTGGGKTACYMGAAIHSKKRTCIITSTRALQTQLLNDFSSVGLVDIRGRRNYRCDLKEEYTCEEGFAARCPYKGTVGCPASQAEMRAARSMLVVTNYDKWTSARKFGTGMEGFEQVIFDEGHSAPEALARAMQVTLNHKEIEEELKIPFLTNPEAQDMSEWKEWAAAARVITEDAYTEAMARITGVSDPKPAWVKKVTHLRNVMRRLAVIASASAKDWIVDEIEKGYQFDPIRPGRYAESALLLRVPRIIISSATIRPKTMFMIGLGKDSFDFHEYDSDFDPKRCPIYWIPTMRVDKNAEDLAMLWVRLDQIAARRQDRNGIVHTISYIRRDEIVERSRFAHIMLINPRGEAATSTIETFKSSPPPTLLVSPSVGTGYDFPGSQCEYQFICKIPFPDGRSKIVKARQEDDKEYGPYMAMQDLVQMIGRAMRSKDDRAESFLCDNHIEWFLPRYGHLAPKSFHGFFRTVNTVPPPPPKL